MPDSPNPLQPPPPTTPLPEPQPLALPPRAARLRVYIGAAPGVGKTYTMLEHAHQLKASGTDIVIGFIEAHGRRDTLALIHDLEIIPLRQIHYRSVTLEEMDLDAILARRPHTVLIDELPHTNVPGSRNRKRYEDVLELLDAGINVQTAVNVQHVETLNDAVARSARTTIRETIPDSFLRRADELVNVDVSIDELRTRLREGKIYKADRVDQALANFFRKGNLTMLRELALRTTAEQVSVAASEYRRAQGLEQAPVPEKVMVCLSHRPGTERLVRTGARIAGRLATNWYAVYVEGARGHKPDSDPAGVLRLEEYRRLAKSLGAQVITLEDKHVGDALIAFAKRESISHVVFGQAARSRLDLLLRGSVINDFLNEMRDTTVQVVPMNKPRRNAER
ncbi:universal stress protein [Acidipila sp. EB88]|uniref:universal stress protein n=1 Tax=Acidipila sp. EB88 TaxID=2305226 RepID=UPI001F48E4EF|nr:universal stress protein [Acidipila sp. EB88]